MSLKKKGMIWQIWGQYHSKYHSKKYFDGHADIIFFIYLISVIFHQI